MPVNTLWGHLLPTSPTNQSPALARERAACGGGHQGNICPRDLQVSHWNCDFLKRFQTAQQKPMLVSESQLLPDSRGLFQNVLAMSTHKDPGGCWRCPSCSEAAGKGRADFSHSAQRLFLEENSAKAREGLRANEALDGGSAAAAPRWLWCWHLSVCSRESSALAACTPRWAVE